MHPWKFYGANVSPAQQKQIDAVLIEKFRCRPIEGQCEMKPEDAVLIRDILKGLRIFLARFLKIPDPHLPTVEHFHFLPPAAMEAITGHAMFGAMTFHESRQIVISNALTLKQKIVYMIHEALEFASHLGVFIRELPGKQTGYLVCRHGYKLRSLSYHPLTGYLWQYFVGFHEAVICELSYWADSLFFRVNPMSALCTPLAQLPKETMGYHAYFSVCKILDAVLEPKVEDIEFTIQVFRGLFTGEYQHLRIINDLHGPKALKYLAEMLPDDISALGVAERLNLAQASIQIRKRLKIK